MAMLVIWVRFPWSRVIRGNYKSALVKEYPQKKIEVSRDVESTCYLHSAWSGEEL